MNMQFTIYSLAFVFAFIIAAITGKLMIPILIKIKFGQVVRDDGPQTHLKKMGIPTMGGVIFLIPLVILGCYFAFEYPEIIPAVIVTIGFGVIGAIDDLIKIIKKRKDGLYAGQKMAGLLIVSTVFALYVTFFTNLGTDIMIPFLGIDYTIHLGPALYIPFVIFVLIAVTNAVNLTDGVDGLAGGVTLIIMLFFTLVATVKPEWGYIKLFAAVISGALIGFLVYNFHPAKVFMGDSGSLALGGAVAATAILMKMPLIILIIGVIYIAENLSVLIQVGYYKMTGKRVFRMAPLHHHFELGGWKETKVVYTFWGITIICCIIAFFALRLS